MSTEPEPTPALEPTPRPNPWPRLLPIIVFLVALLIRLPGLGWGLKNDLHNQSYHPDEPVIWAYSQQIEPAKLDFVSEGFYNYGTLYLSLLRVASDMTAAYTGAPDPRSADSVWAFVSRAHFAGRLLSAFAGAGTVLAVFLLLRRRTNDVGAAAGALLIAVAPGHVLHSRFQTVDVLATFFLALSALFALRLLDRTEEESGIRDAVLAGLFAGLSAGTKYTGVLAILTLLTVLALSRRRHLIREGLAGVAVAVVSFLVVTPGAVLETGEFVKDFKFEMAHTATGHGLVFTGTGSGFAYHFTNLCIGAGFLLTLMGLVGLAVWAYRRERWILALLAFFVPYYILIGRAEVTFLRYTFPLYIALAAGFGALVGEGHRRKGVGLVAVVLGILGLGGVDSRGLMATANLTQRMMGEDSRDQAVRDLRSISTDETTVGLAQDPWFWSPPFFPDSTATRAVPLAQRLDAMAQASRPRPVVALDANGGVPSFNPALVRDVGPDYIAMTSLEFDPLERLVRRTDVPKEAQAEAAKYADFMKALSERYALHRQYGAYARVVEDMEYVHPVVMVWKRKDATP